MTAVLVHGVPETPAVWAPLVEHLERDDVALLQLPGFGSSLPDGFEPTMNGYADWLALELSAFDEVDLVAHDWGGILSLRVLAAQPSNVRSWAIDIGDLGPDFRWHDAARAWQTPGDGEALMDGMVGASPADRASLLAAVGVPEQHSHRMAADLDATMGAAILVLYRSAVDVGNEWGPGIDDIRSRGLVVASMLDPFRNTDRARRLAKRTGADIVELPDCGHFWMLEQPERCAQILTEHWRRG
ncbi:MAG: alpha/beta hydrolase [Acidimicrobiales bacterium]